MYHFFQEVAAGKMMWEWTRGSWGEFCLARVSCLLWNRSGQFQPIGVEVTPSALPQEWQRWIDRMENYFEKGEPLPEAPWIVIAHGRPESALPEMQWTEFQTDVYRAISKIPHGETRPYSWVAEKIGKPFASRAVGQALKKNPIPILIPCHRVVSSHGGFGGFMGESDPDCPELQLKRHLIQLEEGFRSPVFPFLTPQTDGWSFEHQKANCG